MARWCLFTEWNAEAAFSGAAIATPSIANGRLIYKDSVFGIDSSPVAKSVSQKMILRYPVSVPCATSPLIYIIDIFAKHGPLARPHLLTPQSPPIIFGVHPSPGSLLDGRESPRRSQDASKTLRDAPRRLQDGSKRLQDASRRPQDVPRRPQEASQSRFFIIFDSIFHHFLYRNNIKNRYQL